MQEMVSENLKEIYTVVTHWVVPLGGVLCFLTVSGVCTCAAFTSSLKLPLVAFCTNQYL